MKFLERLVPGYDGAPDVVVLVCAPSALPHGLPILEFEATVSRLLRDGIKHIVINLATVDRIDSRTIQALLHANQFSRRQDARLILSAPPSMLSQTLLTLGLDTALTSFPTDDEAVQYLKSVGRGTGHSVIFQRADEPEWVAYALSVGSTLDGLILSYPWRERHSAIDPKRLKIGRWINLRMSWQPDKEVTAEIESIEPVPNDPLDACYYHIRFRNYGWDDGPGSAPRTAPLEPQPGESDAHAE
ncbi:MAG: STAS domain-containing protein [Planctomycetota bacterium]